MGFLVILLVLCMTASVAVATHIKYSMWKPYSCDLRHFVFERMVEERLLSMNVHDKGDFDAFLSFIKSIMLDPYGPFQLDDSEL